MQWRSHFVAIVCQLCIALCIGSQPQQREVVVVGAGLTGATTAFYLQRAGKDVLLAEATDHVGGLVNSKSGGGFLWEEGPNSFTPTPELVKLAQDLRVDNELIFADGKAPRFVYVDGKRHRMPMSFWSAISTSVVSTSGKLRALAGLLGLVRQPPRDKDESVYEFMSRHLGEEVMQRLMDPFVSGVYAGDPKRLSMKSCFPKLHRLDKGSSLLFGMFGKRPARRTVNPADNSTLPVLKNVSLGSFRNGLQTIPNAIARELGNNIARGHALEVVRKVDDGFELQFRCSHKIGPVTVKCKQLVLATPAHVTANLLQSIVPQARLLQQIYYPTIAAVALAYPKSAFREPLEGFGHLIPRSTGIRTLGTIYCTALFPGRAPEGYETVLSFIGGATDPLVASLSQDPLIEIADRDLREILLRPDAPPAQVVTVKMFQKSIPQYEIGYSDIIEQVNSAVAQVPGLHIAGNYKSGVAVGDCIAAGMETAAEVKRQLSPAECAAAY